MARPIRIEYEGAVYHVTLRGNDRKAIFKTDEDREKFIEKLAESVERYDVRLYMYTLMTNHTHFVLETPRGNLSRFMQRFQTAYTVHYNRKHNRSGHLMQGRFGASVVDEDRYILKLSRYVHLNPVFIKANKPKAARERVLLLRDYRWSSYRSYVGKCKREDFVDYEPVLAMMDGPARKQASQYRRFVEAGIVDIDSAVIYAKQRSRLCIGSDDSLERIESLYHDLVDARHQSEDVSFRNMRFSIAPDEVINLVCSAFGVEPAALYQRTRNSLLRPMAATLLCHYSGLTQREVAERLRIGGSAAVSKQLKRLPESLKTSEAAKKLYAQIEAQLQKKYTKA
jgi:putative transposase